MSKELIVAILEDRIYVYQMADLGMKDAIETAPNPDGICELNQKVLACPDKKPGELRINNYLQNTVSNIPAHNNPIQAIAVNSDSTWVATASDKGTLIRIWNTSTGGKVKEVRRGSENAKIFSLAFSKDSSLIAVCSDSGTCHLFSAD